MRPELVYGGTQQEISFIKDYLLIPKSESPLLQTGWTLIHEMYFYIFFAAILLVPLDERRRFSLIVIWGLAVVGAGFLLTPTKAEQPILRLMTNPMTLEFVAGAVAAYIWRASKGALGLPVLIAGVIALVAGIVLRLNGAFDSLFTGGLDRDWERVILHLPAAALLTYGAASIELRQGWKLTGLPVSLGDWSYSLYLTHMLSANAFGLVWGRLAMPGLADNVVGLAAITVACTLVAWASYALFEQPVLNRTKALGKKILG